MRAVLDSSVLVAAIATPNPASASRLVLVAASAGALGLVVTDELEAEYRRAVEYPKVVRYSAKVNRQAFVSAVVGVAERVDAAHASGLVSKDPGDEKVVGAALGGHANFLVTLDKHLLELQEIKGTTVIRPGDLLRELRAMGGL